MKPRIESNLSSPVVIGIDIGKELILRAKIYRSVAGPARQKIPPRAREGGAHRLGPETMLDAGAFDPGCELTADFLGELGGDLVAQEGGHVFGFDGQDGLPGWRATIL